MVIKESEVTPESVYLNRRQLLTAAGFLGMERLMSAAGAVQRNPEFELDRPITPEAAVLSYNNFYEFHGTDKQAVKDLVGKFVTHPWAVEVGGLVNKPKTFDIDDLLRTMPLEERLYRHRCVEAWSMAVPWTGFPLSALIKAVDPKPEAKFVRFISVKRDKEMPGIPSQPWYPWPYFEGLRMDEAMNPLALVVTGLYGKALPKQNWKYGFKSAKSLVKIEFVKSEPMTFWHKLQPDEYGFYANVNPKKPHPRWSQAVERMLPNMERRPTLPYNGYEKYVAAMYKGNEW
ncbi:MAG: protein-methionine-sulfoxide reductase catalytic subunit MsrP [Bryobacteraceae bacterium]